MTQKSSDRLPVTALVLLAVAGFVTILTEALPAGLLPQISASFGVSQALAGQWISVYALGSLLAAIPLTAATRHWNRRRVLLCAISGFAIGNLVTATTDSFVVALCGRLVGGMAAGLLWALLAGYAVRMAPARLAGRAMAIAMSGTPVALSIGIPLGTFLGDLMGWRTAFAGLSVIAALLAGGIIALVPDFAGEAGAARLSLGQVLRLPGVRPVLMVTLLYVLAHNVLYTYIAALLAAGGIIGRTDQALLVFGMTALVGIGLVGLAIDRWLRPLTFASIGLFLASTAILLGAPNGGVVVVFGAMAAWGLAFGGAATLFQTASARAAGPAADVAQSMIVTAWNLAIAGGAVLGGTILDHAGAVFLPLAAAMLLVGALVASVRIKATS